MSRSYLSECRKSYTYYRWGAQRGALPNTVDFISQFFPDAKFVFNTRNHDEVARSGWWAKSKPENVSAQLAAQETAFRQYLEKHPNRGIHIHYNDYVNDAEALVPMFSFLGESWNADRVQAVLDRKLLHLKSDDVR